MNTRNCPVCNSESQKGVEIGPLSSEIRMEYQRHGKYAIIDTALSMLEPEHADPKLIAWIKDLDDVHQMTSQLREGVVLRKPEVKMGGDVECDEVYVVAGHKGNPAAVQKKAVIFTDEYNYT